MMTKINIPERLFDTSFGAFKKAVARIMGIKRLKSGADFVEFEEYADAATPWVGKRRFNMGDLWREPLANQSLAEGEPSDADIARALHEAISAPK
jgi:hypothetical protein